MNETGSEDELEKQTNANFEKSHHQRGQSSIGNAAFGNAFSSFAQTSIKSSFGLVEKAKRMEFLIHQVQQRIKHEEDIMNISEELEQKKRAESSPHSIRIEQVDTSSMISFKSENLHSGVASPNKNPALTHIPQNSQNDAIYIGPSDAQGDSNIQLVKTIGGSGRVNDGMNLDEFRINSSVVYEVKQEEIRQIQQRVEQAVNEFQLTESPQQTFQTFQAQQTHERQNTQEESKHATVSERQGNTVRKMTFGESEMGYNALIRMSMNFNKSNTQTLMNQTYQTNQTQEEVKEELLMQTNQSAGQSPTLPDQEIRISNVDGTTTQNNGQEVMDIMRIKKASQALKSLIRETETGPIQTKQSNMNLKILSLNKQAESQFSDNDQFKEGFGQKSPREEDIILDLEEFNFDLKQTDKKDTAPIESQIRETTEFHIDEKELKRLEKEAENNEEEQEERQSSSFWNIFYLLTSFLFIIIFVTELDLTGQQKIAQLAFYLIDNKVYDFYTMRMRKDVTNSTELYNYLKDALLPTVYDEYHKKNFDSLILVKNTTDKSTQGLRDSQEHYFGYFDYYAGMRFSFKKQKLTQNSDDYSNIVIESYINYNFDVDTIVDDYQEPIKNPQSGKTYQYQAEDGPRFTGAYTMFFESSKTYQQARDLLDDIHSAGFFDDSSFLYFACEILVYNEGFQYGGFLTFEHYKTSTGTLETSQSLYRPIFPQNYAVIDGPTLFKEIIIFIYVIGLFLQFIQLLYTFYQIIKVYIARKELEIAWYDYIAYWFILYSKRTDFNLPVKSIEQLKDYSDQAYYISQYLNLSSIAVVLLCVKNLRILNIYFPSFGILFDTFRTAYSELLSFIVLCGVFLIAFTFAASLLFGQKCVDYRSAPISMMSLFRMIVGEFKYKTLEAANPDMSLLFFLIYVSFFFLILLNMLITIVSESFDKLRQQKALDSMAKAKVLSKDNLVYFKKWMNLVLCKMDSQKEIEDDDSDFDDNEAIARARKDNIKGGYSSKEGSSSTTQKKKLISKNNPDEKKDLKTIFLHNKAQLFQKTMLKSNEDIENELIAIKKDILKKKFEERIQRIRRFQNPDEKAVKKFKNAIIYVLFLVTFVVMQLTQVKVPIFSEAQKGLKKMLAQGKFTSVQYYAPFNSEHSIFTKFPSDQILAALPKQTIGDINTPAQTYDWLNQTLIKLIYDNPNDIMLRQNFFFGETRARINVRRVNFWDNQNQYTNASIPGYRDTDELDFDDYPSPDEIQSSFKGAKTNTTYRYVPAGNITSYHKYGGFVINLPNNKTQAQKIIQRMIQDDIIDSKFANMVIEYVTYSPTYQFFILSTAQFTQSQSGLVKTYPRCKVIRKNLYTTKEDKFRAFVEILYVLFVLYYASIEIIDYVQEWKKVVQMVSIIRSFYTQQDDKFKAEINVSENPDNLEKVCVFLDINHSKIVHRGPVTFPFFITLQVVIIIYIIFGFIKWIIKQLIRSIRVLLRDIQSDAFKMFNLASITLSLQLIYLWINILVADDFQLDSNGNMINSDHNQIELLSHLAKLYDDYLLISSVNTMLIFLRTFQFFSFSFKLSAFTEILSSSKNDVVFFMLMFVVIIFGYSVMGYSMFGQYNSDFSSIFMTVIQLFEYLIEYFDYDSLAIWNKGYAPIFFVTFMLLGDQLLKNMFIAIIVAYYQEFHYFGKEVKQTRKFSKSNKNLEKQGLELMQLDNQDQSGQLYRLVFKTVRNSFCSDTMREKAKKDNSKKFLNWYIQKWDDLELWLFRDRNANMDDQLEVEIKQLEEVLTKKYSRPEYDNKKIPQNVKPFLFSEERDYGEQSGSQQNDSRLENEEFNRLKREKEARKEYELKYGAQNEDNNYLMVNYIEVIPKNFDGMTEDELTSANVWVAALEKILFKQSQKKIIYSDLYECEDFLQQYDLPIYDMDKFSDFQAQFLMKDDCERIEIWETSSINRKFQLWQIMDFEKIFNDENNMRDEFSERLENYIELISQMNKDWERTNNSHLDISEIHLQTIAVTEGGAKTEKEYRFKRAQKKRLQELKNMILSAKNLLKNVPVMTYKKINKSPEFTNPEFSKASDIQKYLWCQHTAAEEKYLLWFQKFTPYYQTKLWNKLSFSEDYLINIINTKKYFRQDLALKIAETLIQIRKLYVEQLEEEYDNLNREQEKDKKAMEKLKTLIDEIKSGMIKLEDAVKMAPFNIRSKLLSSQFYLECLEIMRLKKQKVYKKIKLNGGGNGKNGKKRLLEQLQAQREKVQEEDIAERMRILMKKKTSQQSVIELEKLQRRSKTGNLGSFTPLKIIDEEPGGSGLYSQGLRMKLNTTDHNFERQSPEKSISQTILNHTRNPSNIPFLSMFDNKKKDPEEEQSQTKSPKAKISGDMGDYGINVNPNGGGGSGTFRQFETKSNFFEGTQRKIYEESPDLFEKKKIPEKIYIETLKTFFALMNNGISGDRLEQLKSKFDEQHQIQKYWYLVNTMDKNEERLPLWLCMSEEDRLKMLSHEHILGEVEIMTMLLIDEVEKSPGSNYKLAEIDRKLERALDNQIYDKYRYLTEMQALKITTKMTEKRFEQLLTEDMEIMGLIKYIQDKEKQLTTNKQILYKNILKKDRENVHYREQYEKKLYHRQLSNNRKKLNKEKQE